MEETSLAQKMLLIMLGIMVFTGLIDFAFLAESGGTDHYYNINNTLAARMTGDGSFSTDLVVGYDDFDIESADSVDADTGNIFTDIFKSVKGWMSKQETRLGLVTSILRQPAGIMKDLNFPQEAVTAFGIIWYSMASLALLSLFTGRK